MKRDLHSSVESEGIFDIVPSGHHMVLHLIQKPTLPRQRYGPHLPSTFDPPTHPIHTEECYLPTSNMPQIILIELKPAMIKSMHHLMRKRALDPPRRIIIILTYHDPHFLIEASVYG